MSNISKNLIFHIDVLFKIPSVAFVTSSIFFPVKDYV